MTNLKDFVTLMTKFAQLEEYQTLWVCKEIFTETLRFIYETVIFRKSGFNSLTMRSTLKFEKT